MSSLLTETTKKRKQKKNFLNDGAKTGSTWLM